MCIGCHEVKSFSEHAHMIQTCTITIKLLRGNETDSYSNEVTHGIKNIITKLLALSDSYRIGGNRKRS